MIIRMFQGSDTPPFSEIHIPDELLPPGEGARLADALARRWASRCEVQPDGPPQRPARSACSG